MNKSGYMTRALQARDPRFARVLGRLGYDRRDVVADEAPAPAKRLTPPVPPARPVDDDDEALAAARAEYADVVGKRAYHGWNVATLRARIAAAKGA
ncbi:hypothetical protein LUX29_18120 [Aureimonas altamirensis]|uniref:hypothetical protein n=1 Tax=Aureimonas altamirensis TaxID=370622 RepID=UPI001E39944A|nr:hypothetical protein [Aureimonas altamirensis]UHD44920.1 hypothetical protein LUX29_18120 [Aureimonas altamirensis]